PLAQDYESFFREFAHARFDVGLAPLENTQFNLCKTNTKYRDYGACCIAGIYSNMGVYSSCVRHEETGLLADDSIDAWVDALTRLIFEHKLREDIQSAAYKDVYEQYRLELVAELWLEQIQTMTYGGRAGANKLHNALHEVKAKTDKDN